MLLNANLSYQQNKKPPELLRMVCYYFFNFLYKELKGTL